MCFQSAISARDHPRSRGVYTMSLLTDKPPIGSSPLARGLHVRASHGRLSGRIIPARAGFTHMFCRRLRACTDHPRSRGVYKTSRFTSPAASGSSPLARGLLVPFADLGRRAGIIPARAGFTTDESGRCSRWRDHPRSRGVYTPHIVPCAAHWGSSPLARGLQRFPAGNVTFCGIIPARAGFTFLTPFPARPVKDHPRSRGVYLPVSRSSPRPAGSSPLARGLRRQGGSVITGLRIIPARAGFTPHWSPATRWQWDHPRSRGVYNLAWDEMMDGWGSSPLARGLLTGNADRPRHPGIIPARAGFTTSSTLSATRPRDHPRSRGVYTWRSA